MYEEKLWIESSTIENAVASICDGKILVQKLCGNLGKEWKNLPTITVLFVAKMEMLKKIDSLHRDGHFFSDS